MNILKTLFWGGGLFLFAKFSINIQPCETFIIDNNSCWHIMP